VGGDRQDGREDGRPADGAVGEGLVYAASAGGRHRVHRFPGRSKALKVLYDEAEFAAIERAARSAGLRPSGYVATAALTAAQGGSVSAPREVAGRELLEELLRLRLEVRRYGVNVNQIAAAMNAGGTEPPVWLRQVAERGVRTLAAIDEVTGRLSRRLP
jgi:hypothetical protein